MRLHAILARLALACSILAVAASSSAPDDAQRYVQLVESRYHSARTLKAVFLERYSEGHVTVRLESGTAYFSRPGRMRWEYEEPENKLFLTDGKTVWFYVPADHTASRAPMKESSDLRTPLSLITGKSTLSRFCKRIDLLKQAADGGPVTLRCHPRGAPDTAGTANRPASAAGTSSTQDAGEIQEVLLDVDPTNGWLTRVLIRQAGGIELEYSFGRWQKDMDLPESMFHFTAPKGVAIVDEGTTLGSHQ
ncbi:MAG: outer membrane lipoprotein carrier protein LolA [Candidatus Acidiferrales bacterium]